MSEDMYIHRPPAQAFQEHLRRYPRHYATLALFALAMMLVPAVGGDDASDLAGSVTDPASTGSSVATPSSTRVDPGSDPVGAAPAASATGSTAGSDAGVDRSPEAGEVPSSPAAPSEPPGSSNPGGPVPAPPDDAEGTDAGPAGVDLPPPPALPLPPVPAELEPLLAAVGPLTTQGCSSIGLAGVVLAVAAPSAGGQVPVAEIMPYLAPAYSACATFPPPSDAPTVCALDEAAHEAGYPRDVSGLMKTPNIIGIGIDTLYGIEAAVAAYTGQSPGFVGALADELGCH